MTFQMKGMSEMESTPESFVIDAYIDEVRISEEGIFISCQTSKDIFIPWCDERISKFMPK